METRSFADYLRALDDQALLALFALRPDLVSPVPPEFSSLAIRASSSPSLARAIDSLNEWQFQVLVLLQKMHAMQIHNFVYWIPVRQFVQELQLKGEE